MTRRPIALAAVVALALGVAGCAERDDDERKLLRLLDGTANLSNRYVYVENTGGNEVVVRGLVEDDFRFKARITLNSVDILDEVVNDDTLAVRFLDPSVLPQFVKVDSRSTNSPLEVLSQRRWVIDRSGAPPVGLAATDEKFAGVDPVVDSLAALSYARLAITEALRVIEYNPESISYDPKEDPFPTPTDNSGITRWDVVTPFFPRLDAVARSGNQEAAVVTTANFRKLSVYVKDNRIIQVRERVAAEGKLLEKFEEYMKAFARQGGDDAEKAIDEIIDRFGDQQRAQLLLQVLNTGLVRGGRPPVRFRSMSYELRDLGARVEVGLPADVTEGKLDFFGVNAVRDDSASGARVTGRTKSTGSTESTEGDGSTTTTAPSGTLGGTSEATTTTPP